jgi:hypothetical protein
MAVPQEIKERIYTEFAEKTEEIEGKNRAGQAPPLQIFRSRSVSRWW